MSTSLSKCGSLVEITMCVTTFVFSTAERPIYADFLVREKSQSNSCPVPGWNTAL